MEPKQRATPSMTKNISINSLGIILQRSISLITVPIITRILTPFDYGITSTYVTWVAFLGLFVGLQVHGSLNNAQIDLEANVLDRYRSSILFAAFLSAIVCFIPFCLFGAGLESLLHLPRGFGIILVPQCFFTFCITFMTSKFSSEKKADKNLLLSLCFSIASVTLSILLAKSSLFPPSTGYLYGGAIPAILLGLGIFLYIMFKGRTLYNPDFWKYCLPLTLPLIFHGMATLVLSQSDRLMIRYMVGEEETGLYSFLYNIVALLTTIWAALNSAWIPFYFDYLKKNDFSQIRVKVRSLNTLFACGCAGFILVCPEVIRFIAAPTYWQKFEIIPVIALGMFFIQQYSFPTNYEFYHKKTVWVATGTVSAALVNIALNFWMIPLWGGIGAAIATAISYLALYLFHDYIARHILKGFEIPYKIFLPGIAIVTAATLFYYIAFDSWLLRWVVGAAIGVFVIVRVVKKKSII